MALYSGLSPTDALQKWYSIRQNQNRSPEEQQDYLGNMSGLAQENPAAFRMVQQGVNNPDNKTRQVFNPQTGTMDQQKIRGMWSHPETWLQMGFGGALGGVAAAGALGAGNTAATYGGSQIGSSVAPAATAGIAPTAATTGGGLTGFMGSGAGKLAMMGAPYAIGAAGKMFGGSNDGSLGPLNYGGSNTGGVNPSQPSLASMLQAGSRGAVRDQPFRMGSYTMPLANNPTDPNQTAQPAFLPPITANYAGAVRRQQNPGLGFNGNLRRMRPMNQSAPTTDTAA